MKQIEYGNFCDIYGKTLRNKVLEFILELGELDFAASDILEEVKISKPKVYQIIKELEEEKIIIKSREISGIQLYALNFGNDKVKLLMKSFNECLKRIITEFKEKEILEAEVYLGDVKVLDRLRKAMPI